MHYLRICWCYCHNLTHCRTSFPWIQVESGHILLVFSPLITVGDEPGTKSGSVGQLAQVGACYRARLTADWVLASLTFCETTTLTYNAITWVCQVLWRKWSLSHRWKVGVCDGRRPSWRKDFPIWPNIRGYFLSTWNSITFGPRDCSQMQL